MSVPEEQVAIRRMLALRAEGLSLRKIQAAMQAEGITLSHVSIARVIAATGGLDAAIKALPEGWFTFVAADGVDCAKSGIYEWAGSAVFSESFVRDWVAIKLHRPHEIGVTIKTGRADVRKYIIDENEWPAHDLLDLNNYRLDMIVWEEPDRPRAIVEFKCSLLIIDDLVRTSAILSVAHREGLGGYIVVFLMFDRKDKFMGYKGRLGSMTDGRREGDVLTCGPTPVRIGESTVWCGVFAVQAKPSPS